ncbi:dihydrodipicolinate synthase family protein [Epibacterium ulvae]|uniref:dihydrodipicolinate synthase family protein n=1 Tax=Epibacterium ulvae TaxID=1156985 RepID=UPI001BFC42AF|nr:dihydrodipicolinate synthase family protein [Epibacterium ulvae]MBT8154988.1 dihydrodipicolinate synthase family protein [Epibacterium ulvae]
MQGVIAAVPTPVREDRSPIKDLFVEHCQWALANGCDGLNILGSTGEANSLAGAARRQVMGWAAQALPKGRLMVGTGTPSLQDTIALTEHADDLGYGIALVLPPYYYQPVSDSGLVDWYMAVHAALGERPIEIYFYNFPQMTGINIPVDVIADLATKVPERFTGIKDSSGDLDYCRKIIAVQGTFKVFPSSETALETAHADAFSGCISASVNFTAPLAGQAWEQRNNPSQAIAAEIQRQRGIIAGSTLIANVKSLVADRVQDHRWRAVVPPFQTLPEADSQHLRTALGG